MSYVDLGRGEAADSLLRRLIETGAAPSLTYGNLVNGLTGFGKLAQADSINHRLARDYPGSPEIAANEMTVAMARQDWSRLDSIARTLLASTPEHQESAHDNLALTAEITGRLADAARERREARRARHSQGALSDAEAPMVAELQAIRARAELATDQAKLGLDQVCTQLSDPRLAEAYDRAAIADSAVAVYARFAALRSWLPPPIVRISGPALRRLGELYEAHGERKKAIEMYGRFLELWRNADPELPPIVRSVRDRMAKLIREEG